MKKKIVNLTADLNEATAELSMIRRSHAASDVSFQSQLEAKTAEVCHCSGACIYQIMIDCCMPS